MQPAEKPIEKKVQEPVRGPVRLSELTAQWARAKVMEKTGELEAERLKAEILAAGAEPGYADDCLTIRKRTETEGFCVIYAIESKKLEQVLREEHLLTEALEPVEAGRTKLVMSRVKAIAELNPRVARELAKLERQAPVFCQTAAKK